jgi:hypothetical protein
MDTDTGTEFPLGTKFTEIGVKLILLRPSNFWTLMVKLLLIGLQVVPEAWTLTGKLPVAALVPAVSVIEPKFPIPGWENVAVTPTGSGSMKDRVTEPVKPLILVNDTVTCALFPPGTNDTGFGLKMRLVNPSIFWTLIVKLLLIGLQVVPEAWTLTGKVPVAALVPAESVIEPEFPVPGWVNVAVTPLGSESMNDRVTEPVKPLILVNVTATWALFPPGINDTGFGLKLRLLNPSSFLTVNVNESVSDAAPDPLA